MREKEKFASQFREIQPKFSRFFARELSDKAISLPQFALLSQIAVHGTISMSEVGAKLHITKPAVTHLVDRLEKNRYLHRRPHSSDRRISLLELTPRGAQLVREVQGKALHFILSAIETFNTEEKETISRFYAALSERLDRVLARE